ncbi:hypothetical protein [Actinosynnema sp. NPDC020468]|uniref:hypothetical protein n=1 Tax=Actinosynnema sp. NPDC020468 TaxID=3154488 RepID=UPI0033EDE211
MTDRQEARPLTTEDFVQDDRRADDGTVDQYGNQVAGHDTTGHDATTHDAGLHGLGHDVEGHDTTGHDTTGHDLDRHDAVAEDPYDHADTLDNADHTDTDLVDDRSAVVPDAQKPTADALPEEGTPLFTEDEAGGFRDEWRSLQADFVDSPRDAVQRADELVAQVIQSLATTFAEHKRTLEGQWQEGDQVETEELRLALRRYRSFFDQLLSV